MEVEEGRDPIVLQLTDTQIIDSSQQRTPDRLGAELTAYWAKENKEARCYGYIRQLVQRSSPDLILLTGDIVYGEFDDDGSALTEFVAFMDSFDIPWAPVLGNHDGDGSISDFWCANLFFESENCIFKLGPRDMGYGNYVINITENGKIIHTLYMMDTHSYKEYTLPDGTTNEGYDHLWDNQLEWYAWAVKGTNAVAGYNVESTAIMHIPVYEMLDVYNSNYDTENDQFTGIYAQGSFGLIHELPCPGVTNNGFFDLVLELGSTKNIIFGHDHANSASVVIDGVRLTYGLKVGMGAYYEEGMTGGTTITVNSQGKATVEHKYYQ